MDNHEIPVIWLTTELVPVLKSNIHKGKNDLRPIALTVIIMKCFEIIVLNYLSPETLLTNYNLHAEQAVVLKMLH